MIQFALPPSTLPNNIIIQIFESGWSSATMCGWYGWGWGGEEGKGGGMKI